MFRSLRSRLLITYLLVSALVLAIVGIALLFFLLTNPQAQRVTYSRIEFAANALTLRDMRSLLRGPIETLQNALQRFDQASNVRVLILTTRGSVLADSRPEAGLPDEDQLTQIASSQQATQDAFRDQDNLRWLYVSRPIVNAHTLVVAAPSPILRTLLAYSNELLLKPLVQAGVVALVASLVFAWLISRWVAAPLQSVSRAAKAVAAGDYSTRPAPAGPNEVESLAISFNEMVQQVQSSQVAQRDFVANVSHELKTPLTSIQGFAQAIQDGTAGDPEAQRHAASVIFDESDRLRRLVDDLLDLAKLDTGQVAFQRRPVDLTALLDSVVEKLSLSASERGVRIENHIPSLPTLIGDGDRLAQVFTNLVDNAVKHSPEGGSVALRGEESAGVIRVHVEDQGPGIPDAELSRIFERFYQLDKARSGGKGRGVGLGLAISREIIQAHHGQLKAHSEVGRGSRFTVELPVARHDDETLVQPLNGVQS
ncbi:MAG: HAMP domain-containing sensor histidine kinase [Anaerolineales bacterium]